MLHCPINKKHIEYRNPDCYLVGFLFRSVRTGGRSREMLTFVVIVFYYTVSNFPCLKNLGLI